MRHRIQLVLLLAVAAITGCKTISNPLAVNPGATGTVFMWIAPVADTYVADDQPDMNFYKQGDDLIQRAWIPGTTARHVTSYVKFLLPTLPPGTKIDEAYFELYHGGTNEDGTTDDVYFNVSTVGAKWRADSITWNNGPDMKTLTNGVNPIAVKLHSTDWCGTHDISDTIGSWFADTSKNTGFRITLGDQRNFYKSFYSNNTLTRTDSTVGKAPRLLVKIELPDTASTKDIIFPQLPTDMDVKIGEFTLRRNLVWMADYRGGTDWPADWGVKKGQ